MPVVVGLWGFQDDLCGGEREVATKNGDLLLSLYPLSAYISDPLPFFQKRNSGNKTVRYKMFYLEILRKWKRREIERDI